MWLIHIILNTWSDWLLCPYYHNFVLGYLTQTYKNNKWIKNNNNFTNLNLLLVFIAYIINIIRDIYEKKDNKYYIKKLK